MIEDQTKAKLADLEHVSAITARAVADAELALAQAIATLEGERL